VIGYTVPHPPKRRLCPVSPHRGDRKLRNSELNVSRRGGEGAENLRFRFLFWRAFRPSPKRPVQIVGLLGGVITGQEGGPRGGRPMPLLSLPILPCVNHRAGGSGGLFSLSGLWRGERRILPFKWWFKRINGEAPFSRCPLPLTTGQDQDKGHHSPSCRDSLGNPLL